MMDLILRFGLTDYRELMDSTMAEDHAALRLHEAHPGNRPKMLAFWQLSGLLDQETRNTLHLLMVAPNLDRQA